MATILILESRLKTSRLAYLVAHRGGHEVAVISDLQTARQALGALRFDLVIVESGLEEPCGILRALRLDAEGLPVVFLAERPSRPPGDRAVVLAAPHTASAVAAAIAMSLARAPRTAVS